MSDWKKLKAYVNEDMYEEPPKETKINQQYN